MLDLWAENQAIDDRNAVQHAGEMPAGFGDAFDAAWHEGQLFSSSAANENAHRAAVDSYVNEVKQLSGQDIRGDVYKFRPFQDPTAADLQASAQGAVAKIKQERPDLQIPDLTDDELNRRAVAASADAHKDYVEMSGREKTFGGKLGSFLGSTASATVDPINLVGLAAAPEAELGTVATAALWGGIGAGSQAINEVANAPFRNQVQPGYLESGQPAGNILEAGIGGLVLGGLFKAIGATWTRMKTGEWPRSVRDAGNIVESEANIQQSNVLPGGPEGEAAHREALAKSIDDIVAGRSVVAPESVSQVPEPQPGGIVAYHGSPHDFDRFDISKIGTGEGAQAYGHGLYFAENKSVAEGYKNQLSGAENGNVYRVRINADADLFIDWDKSLNEQPPAVKDALAPIVEGRLKELQQERGGIPLSDPANELTHEAYLQTGNLKASEFYHMLTDAAGGDYVVGKRSASDVLQDRGIPGIKYLDQGSRDFGEGSRNYVVFNDKNIQITHKNGQSLDLFASNEAKLDQMMDERGAATSATAAAKAERATSTELPFVATVKEAKAEFHAGTIADGLIRMGVPKDDAPALAARVIAAKSDDEARAILSEAMARPQTIADTVPSVSAIAKAERAAQAELPPALTQEDRTAALTDPDHEKALNTELERLRDTGQGGMIPFGVDEKGEPTYRLLDEAIQDAANDRDAAEQIEACVNPPAEAEEETRTQTGPSPEKAIPAAMEGQGINYISDIVKRSGLSKEDVHAWLLDQAKQGNVTIHHSTSVIPDEVMAGAIHLPGFKEPFVHANIKPGAF